MAPDPKEVRIGSHVEYHGDRCRVLYIAPKNKIYQFYLRRKGYPFDIHAHVIEVNPIPITPELLTEIGFEKHDKDPKWFRRGDTYIEFTKLIDDRWRLLVCSFDDIYNAYHSVFLRYLHEAESFLFLAAKKELIND